MVTPMNNTTIRMRGTGPARLGPAFTLMELLVVIVIISLLLTILVPSVFSIRRDIARGQTQAVVRLLAGACEYYKQDDIGSYPDSTPATMGGYPMKGRNRLVEALTGYLPLAADGEDGFGWRAVKGGRKCGPYHGAEEVATKMTGNGAAFVDTFGGEIYYYRYDTTGLKYNPADNDLGPADINVYAKDTAGTDYLSKTFLIMSKGSDGVWASGSAMSGGSDDITNFRPQ